MKLIIADDTVYLGSANYDTRSLYINVELMLRVSDKAFAAALRNYFSNELKQSQPVTSDWLKTTSGRFRKLRWFAAYFLFSTIDYTISRRFNIGPDRHSTN